MYQKLILTGNVGREPELRYTPSGAAVTSFSMAVNDQYTNQAGEKVIETTWFRVTTWGKVAEICNQYVKKGMVVLVEGKLTADKATGNPRVYQKKDGTSASNFEVNASTVRFLSRVEQQDEAPAGEIQHEEDIPF